MKSKEVFFNPFRLISPKLDAEASRLEKIYETPPAEVTCLEEGLVVMLSKLETIAELAFKTLLSGDPTRLEQGKVLGHEVHAEEKSLTGAIVCYPQTTNTVLKAVILFPGRLERIGDLMENVLNCSRIKSRDGIVFSDKAIDELTQTFKMLTGILRKLKDTILSPSPEILNELLTEEKRLAQMNLNFALAHEERLLAGTCAPKASSLYLDILDSVRSACRHLIAMTESLLNIVSADGNAARNT
jgi:Na+/phosphate symporter